MLIHAHNPGYLQKYNLHMYIYKKKKKEKVRFIAVVNKVHHSSNCDSWYKLNFITDFGQIVKRTI